MRAQKVWVIFLFVVQLLLFEGRAVSEEVLPPAIPSPWLNKLRLVPGTPVIRPKKIGQIVSLIHIVHFVTFFLIHVKLFPNFLRCSVLKRTMRSKVIVISAPQTDLQSGLFESAKNL